MTVVLLAVPGVMAYLAVAGAFMAVIPENMHNDDPRHSCPRPSTYCICNAGRVGSVASTYMTLVWPVAMPIAAGYAMMRRRAESKRRASVWR